MTSLQGSLPDSASGLWRVDREYGISNTRVKHVVIHEAHVRESPDRHVVYRIDVFTQERNWCVYRRYSEFLRLHEKISEMFKMFKGSFPRKQVSGNLSPAVIEQRRSSLEHYLLKIINSHNQDVSSCPTVLRFLDMHKNDVYHVTSALCRYIRNFGEAIINEDHFFVMSPTQLFCLHKRLRIPNSDADYKADAVFCDLGSLYDFVGRVDKMCVKPCNLQDQGIRSEVTLFRNLKELHIQTVSVSLIKGLASIQLQIERLKASQAVTAMKELLIDSVLERKTQPKQPAGDGSVSVDRNSVMSAGTQWRAAHNSKMIFNSYTIHPWISLLCLDLSHNTIRQLDDSFSLLPNLQELDLSHNQIDVLDLNYINPALNKLVCTNCHVVSVITKLQENLTELTLSHNKIKELTGFNKIIMLKKLNLFSNCIPSVDSIAGLTELPRLHDITLADNPLCRSRSYRTNVLCMFTQACRRVDIVVDGKTFSEKEKKRAKNTRVKGATPSPSVLPFFGSTSDQVPTAFLQNPTEKDGWNSILHDNSSSSTSTSSPDDVNVEEALSPTCSEIRSTPSQIRTYDWDPAQAFASSANSTPPIVGVPVALSGWDKTSSCDEGELGEVVENSFSSVDAISPLLSPFNTSPSLRPFNSAFYQLSGSSELYSKIGTSPEGVAQLHRRAKGSTSGSSKDISDSEWERSATQRDNSLDRAQDDSPSSGRQCGDRPQIDNQHEDSHSSDSLLECDIKSDGEQGDFLPSERQSTDTLDQDIKHIACSDLNTGDSLEPQRNDPPEDVDEIMPDVILSEEVSDAGIAPDLESLIAWEDNLFLQAAIDQCRETFIVDRPDYDGIIFAGGTQMNALEKKTPLQISPHDRTVPEKTLLNKGSDPSPAFVSFRLSESQLLSSSNPSSVVDYAISEAPNHVVSQAADLVIGQAPDQVISQVPDHVISQPSDNLMCHVPDHVISPDHLMSQTPERVVLQNPDHFIFQAPDPQASCSQSSDYQSSVLLSSLKDSQFKDSPIADSPIADIPSANSPIADSPSANSPIADSPSANSPIADSPSANSPIADIPSADSPSKDVYRTYSPLLPVTESPVPSIKVLACATVSSVESPASSGLTENNSSSDEVSRLNRIESLSLGRHVDLLDLYDSEDSDDNSVDLCFSNNKLTF